MRRTFWSISLAVSLALVLPACKSKKDDKKKEPAPKVDTTKPNVPKEPPKPAVEKPTPESIVKRMHECMGYADARELAKFKECYAADVKSSYADAVPPMAVQGSDALVAGLQEFQKAFSDHGVQVQMAFVKDQDVVSVVLSHGTNDGAFMGMPATNKTMGVFSAGHVKMNDKNQIAEEVYFMDQGSMMGQLTGGEWPHRAAVPAYASEPLIVIAKGDANETTNVKMIEEMSTAFNAHDMAKTMSYYSDDARFMHMASPENVVGKEALTKSMEEYLKMTTDVKATATWTWGAGDYVLTRLTVEGTNNGPMPGGKPATNKPYKNDELNIYRIADGKIASHWIFSNGMSFAVQLGLMPNPAEMPKGGAPEAAPKAAPKAG